MRWHHCKHALLIASAVALSSAAASTSQQAPAPAPRSAGSATASFTIFIRAMPIGSEQVAVSRSGDGWTITGSGRLNAPLDIASQRLQLRYDPNWMPLELTLDGVVRGKVFALRSTVSGDTVTDRITEGDQSTTETSMGRAELLLPHPFFAAPYEALAAKLRTAPSGSTISVHATPQDPFSIRVGDSSPDRFQTATQMIDARHTRIALLPVGAPAVDADVWGDSTGRLLRISIPLQSLDIVREDLASVAARRVPISRPNDEQVRIPSSGFSLSGTLSRPAGPMTTPAPAVVFIGGSGPADRDELVLGIPILGELAGAVADAGFLTLRYDKRGVGQSGGRLESASIADLADDAIAAVKVLARRKDVDPKRIAVIGYSDGSAVALLAAAKEKQISAVAVISAAGVRGADLILEQQQRLLSRLNLPDTEKQAKVELQKRINEAIITGKGRETLPVGAQRQTDNAEFASILRNDPAKIIPDVRKPILIVQPELDTEILPVNADRLERLAARRKNAPPVEVVKIPGVNHLLLRAMTGEMEEYAILPEKHISPDVPNVLTTWLLKTLRR
jgi:pimeloyl-ACP methyl ester carboxylesterase